MKILPALMVVGGCMPALAAAYTSRAGSDAAFVHATGPPVLGYVQSKEASTGARGAVKSARKISKVTLESETGSPALAVGGTLQVVAKATYSDGSVATLPDAKGNTVTAWETSNPGIAKVSSHGLVTALARGVISVTAMVGSVAAQSLTVAVLGGESLTPEVVEPPASPVTAPSVEASVGEPAPEVSSAAGTTPEAQSSPSAGTSPSAAENPGPATSPAAPAESPAAQSPIEPVAPPTQLSLAGPVPAPPAGPLPDSFIGPFWTTVSPAGGSASISNSHLFLGVPGGANHDPFSATNQAVRVVQPIGDVDFDVAIKIDSPLVATDGNTSQGLMVLAANGDFLTFALTTNGTSIGLMARTVTAGAPTTVLDDSAFSEYQSPIYLRLRRSGSAYVALYSVDGATWKQAASFTAIMTAAAIGPFASNFSSTPANAMPVVMAVNWFEVQ